MNTLDRIIRIVYKEIPLSKLMNNRRSDCKKTSFLDKYSGYFNFSNPAFRRIFKHKYMEIYPNNYNEDEIDYFIKDLESILSYKYSIGKIGDFNSIKLILYVSEKLLFLNSGELKIYFEDLLEFNGFINKIDGNILMAAKLALENREVDRSHKLRVDHDNTRLIKILEKGISENHMHLKGSGYTTDMNWYEFSNRREIVLKELEGILRRAEGNNYIDEAISFYQVRFIKFFLFAKIKESKEKEYDKRFGEEKKLLESIREVLDYQSLEEYIIYFSKNKKGLYALQEEFLSYYNYFANSVKKYYLIERSFLKDLFILYLQGDMDDLTLYLFNLYLLATSKFKFLFNQDNIGMGFKKFKHSEDIKSVLLKEYSDEEIFKTVFDKYYGEKNVKKIEFRTTPKKTINDYIKLIDSLNRADKKVREKHQISDKEKIDYGLIIHYIKNKDEFDLREGCSRKEKTYSEYEVQCDVLVSFFTEFEKLRGHSFNQALIKDEYRNKIVGIDTANYEFNCRPEVFGYIFRKQRKDIYSSHILKFTYHVGEDFTSLSDGLRAIDEVIEYLNFSRGDRLGHALALGLNVDKYFKVKRYKITQNLESHIDDLVWMRFLISEGELDKLDMESLSCDYSISEIIKYLDDEFYNYFNSYNLSNYNIYDYYSAYRLRGDFPFIYGEIKEIYDEAIKFGYNEDLFYDKASQKYGEKLNINSSDHKKHFLNPNARELFFRYHFSKNYKEKHNVVLSIGADDKFIAAVKLVQLLVRKKVYKLQIGIESNPSSNRKISFVDKYIELPLLNFNRRYLKNENKYNLLTSINTDDSAIFQTDLSLEYAYVVATLEREGYDIEDIYEYIDYIRETSMQQSFVLKSDI